MVRLVAHSARMHVCVCSMVLVIMRHCSRFNNNCITELPAQIFAKNVNVEYLCVCLHCLAAKSAVVRRC